MFRSASTRQSDLAMHRFAVQLDHWQRSAPTWFDGTIASVDERIAKLDHLILHARDTASRLGSTEAGRYCGVALPQLEHSRRELAAVRDSLLNGFSDRQAGARALADRRTTNRRYAQDNPIAPGTAAPVPAPGVSGVDVATPGMPTPTTVPSTTTASLRRAIELGSRDFLAGQNTDDRDELIIRAQRYAADETSTMPTEAAHRIAAAFVGRVEELIARRPRKRTAAAPVTHYEDFDDQLMY